MQALVCEKCARAIPVAHLAEGRALQTSSTKALCAVCCKQAHSTRRRVTTAIKLPHLKPSSTIVRVPSQASGSSRIADETRIVPCAPAAGSARNSQKSRTATSIRIERHWACHACGVHIDPKHVTTGMAELREGVLWCRKCFSKKQSPPKRNRWRAPLLAAGLVALAVVLLVPSAALFVLAAGCACAAPCALLSFDLPWAKRAALAAVACVLAGACVMLMTMLRDHAEIARDTNDLSAYTQRIDAALAQNKVRAALAEIQKLKVAAVKQSGDFSTPAAEARLSAARKSINDWLAAKYPDSNDIGRQLLLAFVEAFPSEDEDRFERINVEGDRLAAVMRLNEDGERTEPGQGLVEERRYTRSSMEAWLVATYVFDRIAAIGNLHLTIKPAGGPPRELEMTRQQFLALRRLPLPQVALSKRDWPQRLARMPNVNPEDR